MELIFLVAGWRFLELESHFYPDHDRPHVASVAFLPNPPVIERVAHFSSTILVAGWLFLVLGSHFYPDRAWPHVAGLGFLPDSPVNCVVNDFALVASHALHVWSVCLDYLIHQLIA